MIILQELKGLVLRLLAVDGISGFEEPMMKALVKELTPFCDEVYDTPIGNIIGIQKGTDPEAPALALVAHTDQVGFVVFNIDETGFIRFIKVGGSVTGGIQTHQMKLHGKKGPAYGVVGIKPGHITKPSEANVIPPIEEMYIDIGAKSKAEVHEMGIEIGTPITWNTKPLELANNLVAASGPDDRVGVATLIQVAKNLKDKPIPSTVYYIGTVEEEIGLRGAAVAVFDLDVDMAVAIDTCPAGWQPDVNMRDLYYEVGKGPAIHVGKAGSPRRFGSQILRTWLIGAAEAEGIQYQSGLVHGGNDAHAVQLTKSGVPACTIAVPRRYSHSPVELFSWDDLDKLIKVLTKAISGLTSGFNLHRI